MVVGKASVVVLVSLVLLAPGALAQGIGDVGFVGDTADWALCVVTHPPYIDTQCNGSEPEAPDLDAWDIFPGGFFDDLLAQLDALRDIVNDAAADASVLVARLVDDAGARAEDAQAFAKDAYDRVPSTHELLRIVEESGLEEQADGAVCTVWRQIPDASCR